MTRNGRKPLHLQVADVYARPDTVTRRLRVKIRKVPMIAIVPSVLMTDRMDAQHYVNSDDPRIQHRGEETAVDVDITVDFAKLYQLARKAAHNGSGRAVLGEGAIVAKVVKPKGGLS